MHGDIKPSNILVQFSSNVEVKLCDLDSARYVNGKNNTFPHSNGKLKYTLGWEAPEVYLGQAGVLKASLAIDLFSLGLLVEILCRPLCNRDSLIFPEKVTNMQS
jgi:serine/threonine protein kinase